MNSAAPSATKPDQPSIPDTTVQYKNPYPWYAPRGWHGMKIGPWLDLLSRNRFRVTPSRIPMATLISFAGPFNELLAALQAIRYGGLIDSQQLTVPPVFILGHWRSGTTLLHELLMLDPRLSFPTTFECFAPSHFLVSEWVFERYLNWLLPDKRPMDNVAFGWARPQEDEFALMNLGLPSPYRRMAFPREGWADVNYLDFDGVSDAEVQRWLATLERFLCAVSCVRPGRLVLKSPTHTGRVAVLANHFRGAKFIHITRDPKDLFSSTLRLWQSLDEVQGLQQPLPNGDRDYVLHCFNRMYNAFHAGRQSLPQNSIVDIRYEDLVKDPVEVLRQVYMELDLGTFDLLETPLCDWITEHHRGYKVNQHQISDHEKQLLDDHWGEYIRRYGY